MFPDEPFVPETVEKQLAELEEHLQMSQSQQQTRNLRLLKNLQQFYQTQQLDSEALNRARRELLQRLEEKTPQGAKLLPLFNETISKRQNTRSVISLHKRGFWRPLPIAAALLVVLLSVAAVFFIVPHLCSSSFPAQGSHTFFNGGAGHQNECGSGSQNGSGSGSLNVSIEFQPFLYENAIYVNSGKDIRAYAAQNGALERTYALSDVGGFTIVDGILYTNGSTFISATRISDSKLLWQAPFGSESTKAPEIVDGVLYGYTYTPDKVFYALDISDGKLLWKYRVENQSESPNSPVVMHDNVYFTSSLQLNQSIDAELYALRAVDGSLLWHHTLGHTVISDLQTDGTMLYVYVDGSVEALRAANGGILWQHPLPFSSLTEMANTSLARVTNTILYAAAGDGTLYAFQATDGKLLWHYQASPGTIFSSFNVEGNVLYVGKLAVSTFNSYRLSSVIALRTSDGHLLWQYHVGEQAILAPIAGQGAIYVTYGTAGQENLYALRVKDGFLLWHRMLYSLLK